MNKKNLWVIIVLILLATGVITFLFWPKPEPEPPSIKIWSYPTPLITTIEKGFFEEENLQVEIIEYAGWEMTEVVQALLTGELDYAIFNGMNISPSIETSLKSAPIKTIMLLDRFPTLFLVAQPELEINELKTIGIPSLYAPLYHFHSLSFIEEKNLEVEIIVAEPLPYAEIHPIGQVQDWLLKDEVDAVLIGDNAYFLQTQGFSVLATLDDTLPGGLIARNDKIEENPEEVRKIIRSLERTMESIVTEPEENKGFFIKFYNEQYEKMGASEENRPVQELVEWFYPHYQASFDRRNVPFDEGAELLIQLVKAGEFETVQEVEEQIVTQEEFDRAFDFRFVK